jgi:hypothetical protein
MNYNVILPHSSNIRAIIISLILLVSLFSHTPTQAQSQETTVKAEVDREIVPVNEQLALTITITGNSIGYSFAEPTLPDMTDFRQVGFNESSFTTVVNGVVTSQRIFVYYIEPVREGRLVIGPIEVDFDQQVFQTEPIEIEAISPGLSIPVPFSGQDDMLPPPFIIEAEVDKLTPYIGEQVIYTFRLYRSSFFPAQPDYNAPSFTDFWSQTVLSQPHYMLMISNTNYSVIEVRTAIFPATLGQVVIEPAKLTIPGGSQAENTLETDPISLQILSLPDGAPENFKGAVGQYEIRAQVDQAEGRVNEPLTLIVEIEGWGNIEVLNEPALPELPDWRVLNVRPSTYPDIREEGVYGIRRFERLIFPTKPGEYIFPSIEFSYYNPDAEEYVTVSTDQIPITIEPATDEIVHALSSDDTSQNIFSLKPVPVSFRQQNITIVNNPLFWGCWIFPAFLVGGAWIFRKRRQQTSSQDTRNRQVYQTACKTLQEATPNVDSYTLVRKTLLNYLSARVEQSTTGITMSELSGLLERAGLDLALINRVQTILNQIDISRFAPGGVSEAKSIVTDAQELINDIEKEFDK